MRSAANNRVGNGRVLLSNISGAAQQIHLASNGVSTGGESWNNEIRKYTLPTGSNQFIFGYNVNTGAGGTTVTLNASRLQVMRLS